jgi:hypothetical protein
MVPIKTYSPELVGVHSENPRVVLSVRADPMDAGDWVLQVEYPGQTADPADRDVWFDVDLQDWTSGRALSFRIRTERDLKLSVSFFDRNHVGYTAWTEVAGGEWRDVQLPFEQMRPNPYFQPEDAKQGAPIDVSLVAGLGVAPHDELSGCLTLGRFALGK